MKFIDSTQIFAIAGKGGDGMVSFHTARNKPKLGPDGGNGGNGGNVGFVGSASLNTFGTLRYKQIFKAQDGGKGATNNKTGKCGEDVWVAVPLGTIIYDHESGEKIGEVLRDQECLTVALGGKRGYGNLAFTNAVRRAPRIATAGKKGEEKSVRLELKLLADLGLAGLPNAGKTSFLRQISSAKGKVADYPFSTLVPQLGVVELDRFGRDQDSFVVADVPGLIEGASQGRGLGHKFLRHLERTRAIAFVIDASDLQQQPLAVVQQLEEELRAYTAELAKKACFILLNKIDLISQERKLDLFNELKKSPYPFVAISTLTGEGIPEAVHFMADLIKGVRDKELPPWMH